MTSHRHIELLQGYYKYLYLGKFMENIIKSNDMSKYVQDIDLSTGEGSYFVLKSSRIQKTLSDIFLNPDKKNIFGYITEISSFRGIFGVVREMLDSNFMFEDFLKNVLGKQYFPFEQIIRFCRNILTHALDSNISVRHTDFAKQKLFLIAQDKHKIIFSFKYSDFIKERKGNKKYGLKIELNFNNIKDGVSFFDLISLHQLYMLSELCFNLTEIFRTNINNK